MNENNTNGINPESTVPTPPVTPEAPVAPAEPVAPVAPVEPTVAQPAEPVAPVQPVAPVAPQPQGFNPGQVPLTNPAPQAPKNNNTIFVVAVIVLVLAIGGLGAFLIFNNSGKKLDNNTTTAAQTTDVKGVENTTQTISTTTREVTTIPNTTTQPRTTRSVDEPTPTKTNANTVKVYNYNISLPGYEYYEKDGMVQAVNKTDKIQLVFNPVKATIQEVVENIDQVEATLQKQGFKVADSASGKVGSRPWILLELSSSEIPAGFAYVYMVTELDADTIVEVYAYFKADTDAADNLLQTLTTAFDNKTTAFAESKDSVSTKSDLTLFDKIDTRLLD